MSFNEENRFSRASLRIAERNRSAKQRFLSQSDKENSSDQTDLDSEFASRGMGRRHVDLSIPGTPVSSKRVMAMKQGLDYDSDEDEDFLKKSRQSNARSSIQMKDLIDSIQKWADETQKNSTDDYANKINEPKILNSETSQKKYPMYSSVPGTPVSSRRMMRYKADEDVEETFDNIKATEEGKDQLQEFLRSMEKLRAEKLLDKLENTEEKNDDKFGYSKVGTYNQESNLKPYSPIMTEREKFLGINKEKSFTSHKVNLTNESTEVTTRRQRLTSLTLNIDDTQKPAIQPSYELLSPTIVRKISESEGFYTRTYSRRISQTEQPDFDKISNDIEADTAPVNGDANGIPPTAGATPKPNSRTSLPPPTSIPAPKSQPPPLRRSRSNAEKFYDILNRFRKSETPSENVDKTS